MSGKRARRKRREPEAIKALKAQQASGAPAAPAPEAAPAPAKKATQGQFQDPDAVIQPDMIPYLFMKEWWRAKQRGDFDFMYALTTEDGPLREHFGDREAFPEVCRRKMRPVTGIEVGELCRIRLNGTHEAHVLQAYGERERERRSYEVQRTLLLNTDNGWRVHQVDEINVEKGTASTDVQLDAFDAVTLPQWFATWREAQPAFVNPKPADLAAADEGAAAEAAPDPSAAS